METSKFEERLQRIMDAAGAKSDSDLARALGIQPPSVAAARKREQVPSGWVEQVAERFGVSADWLLFGESRGATGGEAYTPGQGHACDVDMVYVPLVEAQLSAGTGSFVTGELSDKRYGFRSDFLTRKGQISQMVLMRVEGDSMEPEIHHGDVVLIDQSQTQPRPGAMFAIGVEDLVYIKMVDALPGKLILKSCNDAYPPLEIDARGDLADGIRIVGKAVWLGRELR
jgi:Predicted transcriptional regulator